MTLACLKTSTQVQELRDKIGKEKFEVLFQRTKFAHDLASNQSLNQVFILCSCF